MGVFRKKSDPISERERALNNQIAALEEKIRHLAEKGPAEAEQPAPAPPTQTRAPTRPATPPPAAAKPTPTSAKAAAGPQPRLRSTALPKGSGSTPNPFSQPGAADTESLFEEAEQEHLQHEPEAGSPEHYNELGVRKYDLLAAWKRFKNHFRGPVASNPKLVNYLAAGSIQGLRPLRYERRVARNRFFVFVAVLLAVLWGLIYMLAIKR